MVSVVFSPGSEEKTRPPCLFEGMVSGFLAGVWASGVLEGLRATYPALNVGLGVFVDALREFGVFGGAGGGYQLLLMVRGWVVG